MFRFFTVRAVQTQIPMNDLMIRIRPYQPADKEDVHFICLNSEGPCTDTLEEQKFILATFCDYYIECEPQNCFVAVNNNDRPIGYVISAVNFDAFAARFYPEYPQRILQNKRLYASAMHSADLEQKYKNKFPAHLHINILPEYQRKGIGSALLDHLTSHFRSRGVSGVMLSASEQNFNGQSFYRKYGFTELEKANGDISFGLRLQ